MADVGNENEEDGQGEEGEEEVLQCEKVKKDDDDGRKHRLVSCDA